MSDGFLNDIGEAFRDTINWIGSIFQSQHRDLITVLRQPTPVKYSASLNADANGNIGSGVGGQAAVEIYQAPMSHEVWLNRITISSPAYGPSAPLTTGQIWAYGTTAGEPIFWLPVGGSIAPVTITEGRVAAPHLNPGERIAVQGDHLPANVVLRVDLQVILVTGISSDEPTFAQQRMNTALNFEPID